MVSPPDPLAPPDDDEPTPADETAHQDEDAPQIDRPWWRQPMVWIGVAISALTVGTFISTFDLAKVGAALVQMRPWPMLLGAALFLTSYQLRGWRWKLLLSPLADLPVGRVRDILLIGFMGNWLLPARAGEVARTLILWKTTGTSWRGALATVALERLFDAFTLVGVISLFALLFDVPPQLHKLGWITAAGMLLTLAVAFWLALHHGSFFALFEGALFFVPRRFRQRLVRFFRRFVDGFIALRRPHLLLPVATLSAVIWALEIGVYLCVMWAFELPLPAWVAGVVLAVTNFSIAVPSGPGALGVFEAGCAGALYALGLPWEPALAYAIGLHLLFFVCIVGPGLLLMWRLDLSLSDLTSKKKSPPRNST